MLQELDEAEVEEARRRRQENEERDMYDEFGRLKKKYRSGQDRKAREEAALARLRGDTVKVTLLALPLDVHAGVDRVWWASTLTLLVLCRAIRRGRKAGPAAVRAAPRKTAAPEARGQTETGKESGRRTEIGTEAGSGTGAESETGSVKPGVPWKRNLCYVSVTAQQSVIISQLCNEAVHRERKCNTKPKSKVNVHSCALALLHRHRARLQQWVASAVSIPNAHYSGKAPSCQSPGLANCQGVYNRHRTTEAMWKRHTKALLSGQGIIYCLLLQICAQFLGLKASNSSILGH